MYWIKNLLQVSVHFASVYSKGVIKSTDDGKTWNLKNRGIEENTCAFELTLADNGNLFLTVSPTPTHRNGKKGREFYSGAVYRSTDGAENWSKLNVTPGLLFANGIDIDPQNPTAYTWDAGQIFTWATWWVEMWQDQPAVMKFLK